MQGLLIKPDERKIDYVDLPPRDTSIDLIREAVYTALRINKGSRLVEGISLHQLHLPWTDTLYLDEEGRLHKSTIAIGRFFIGPEDGPPGLQFVFIGRGLVLRTNAQGQWITPKIQRERLLRYVTWEPAYRNGTRISTLPIPRRS